MVWTVEREERLVELVDQGLSSTAIGLEMGTTKSAVIGKMGRMHLKSKYKIEPKEKPQKKIKVIKNAEEYKPDLSLLKSDIFNSPKEDSKRLIDLSNNDCRWKVSIDQDLWCGHTVKRGAYCEMHASRAYQASKTSV